MYLYKCITFKVFISIIRIFVYSDICLSGPPLTIISLDNQHYTAFVHKLALLFLENNG